MTELIMLMVILFNCYVFDQFSSSNDAKQLIKIRFFISQKPPYYDDYSIFLWSDPVQKLFIVAG